MDKVVGGEVEEGLVVGIMMEVFVKAKRMKSSRVCLYLSFLQIFRYIISGSFEEIGCFCDT